MARPKKKVLLSCIPDTHGDALKFLLEMRGPYAVTVVTKSADVLQVLRTWHFDLLLAELRPGWPDANELALEAKKAHEDLSVLLFSRTISSYDRASHADAFLPKGATSSAEMLERVRILTARKRGPKKQAQSVKVADAEAVIA